jgi:arylsulfatase A-like enzyme
MTARHLPVLTFLLLLAGCSTSEKAKEKKSLPNIIVIMTDDHARHAVSAYGSSLIKTPNIDRIANEGVRFDNAFVTNSLCGPARAVALTGKYSHLNGFRDNNDSFDGSQQTFIKLLHDAGYFTAVVGKWHLGTIPQGFDYWKILIDQGQYYNPDFVEMGDTSRIEGYSTDLVTDFAIQTIETRGREKPFCMMLNQKAPHRNWMPNLKHLGLFDTTNFPLPPTFFDDYSTRGDAAREQDMEIRDMFHSYDLKLYLPPGELDPGTGGHPTGGGAIWWAEDLERFTSDQKKLWDRYYKPISDAFYKNKPSNKKLEEWMYNRYIRDYLSCVTSVDENIGRLLKYLEEKKMLDDTIIIYLSDQGFFLGEHGWYDKRFMYEESIRIPLVIRWPEKIPAGTVNNNLVLNLDLAPTILNAAGQNIPGDMQGRSLLEFFNADDLPDDWRTSMYYHYYEFPYGAHKVKKHYGIRTDRYKLIHFYNDVDQWELYDLQADPHEVRNIYNDRIALSDSLKQKLELLRKEYLDTIKLETVN